MKGLAAASLPSPGGEIAARPLGGAAVLTGPPWLTKRDGTHDILLFFDAALDYM